MNLRAYKDMPQFVYDLLATPPHRGEGLNIWLFKVARVLHPYRSPEEILELLQATTYGEPVRPGEIERAIENSKQYAWQPGQPSVVRKQPAWPQINHNLRSEIIASAERDRLVDFWDASPARLEDNEAHSEQIIDALFPGNPLLCCGRSISEFETKSREEWRGFLSSLQFIVPSPMTARIGITKDKEGKESTHTLDNTGARRFLIIEQDQGTLDEQAAILSHLSQFGPLTLVLHSGSKSLHGWWYCAGQTEEFLHRFMQYAVSLGADDQTWCRTQFVRLPDGRRDNGKRQTVYYLNPGAVKI
jgi:hypothetical protein